MSKDNTEYTIDKSTWRDGPWQHEPDRLEWRHLGFPCLIVRAPGTGALCGYVGVDASHPWYGREYRRVEDHINVHGGLAYSDKCEGHICHLPDEGETDDVWWLGFDCSHSGDVMPGLDRPDVAAIRALVGLGNSFLEDGTYKDLSYVKTEVESLAEQLAKVEYAA